MRFFISAIIALSLSLTGCCSVQRLEPHQISITSIPPGASVTVDNQPKGVTPVIVAVDSKRSHSITLAKYGYHPQKFLLKPTINQAIGTNGFFPLAGLTVAGAILLAMPSSSMAGGNLDFIIYMGAAIAALGAGCIAGAGGVVADLATGKGFHIKQKTINASLVPMLPQD